MDGSRYPLFLIPLLPLLGAAISLSVGRRLGKNPVTLIALGSVFASFLIVLRAALLLGDSSADGIIADSFFNGPWIKAGDLSLEAGLVMDRLAAIMCLVVTGVGFLIHVYSTAYMEHDDGYTRFFGYLNLFMGAMLILVLGDSMPVTFVGWEGVGLCSYLLIGFWYDKEANAYAGRKAFIVNRIGDFGFLLAMFLAFHVAGTLKYSELANHATRFDVRLWMGLPAAYFFGLLVLLGATGKSAQIPLYVWLPDAMAGPTPVSALIHAATMVTAGVYVVTRLHPIYHLGAPALAAVAGIGAATALFAATIGIAQRDMKKVLAYSTISQLGFMFVGVGSYVERSSNYRAAIFHLVTHAFFKAGLFLGAGSVMHALSGEGDITRMGGLKKHLPHTRWTFLICCLAIAGIPPFAGFWSKDAIIAGTLAAQWTPATQNPLEVWFAAHLGQVLYVTLLAAAACTAFYMFRLYFLVFHGNFRGTEEEKHHIHESPPAMTIVLWILALGSIVVGLTGIPHVLWHEGDWFGNWFGASLSPQLHEETLQEFLRGAAITTTLSALAIALAWTLYGRGFAPSVKRFVASFPRLYKLVFNKYWIDELYDLVIVRPLRWTAFVLWKGIDSFVIDLIFVNGVGFLVAGVGKLVKYIQNGDVQRYIVGILAGAALTFWAATHWVADRGAEFDLTAGNREVTVKPHNNGPARRLKYRVDWEGKQEYDEKSFTHRYDSAGKKKITIEARDPRWGVVSRETKSVTLP